ncbi:MAG: cytochrome B [Caedibacter sp. 38-128]|nr:MAG: cytochrome B [Caedibacter sp. 38-128]
MLHKLYYWIMSFAGHRHALWVLTIVSFAESSFFPIPPDPLYMAMILGNREKAWSLAIICTLSSVIGGVLGYYIGYALFETFGMWIVEAYGLEERFVQLQHSFQKWGFWIVALKGLTPIPYKIVTITSGVAELNLSTFILASIVARGFRFFSLALLLWHFGPSIKNYIEKNLVLVTIGGMSVLILGFLVVKYLW